MRRYTGSVPQYHAPDLCFMGESEFLLFSNIIVECALDYLGRNVGADCGVHVCLANNRNVADWCCCCDNKKQLIARIE